MRRDRHSCSQQRGKKSQSSYQEYQDYDVGWGIKILFAPR
jgi:hypothetical protein